MAGIQAFKHKPITATMLMALAAPAPALAESAPDQAQLPEIAVKATKDDFASGKSSVGSKTPAELRDIPQSVTVINRALMDSTGSTSLTDALRYVPGITLQSAEGGTIGNNINLNGYSARTDIYLDGFRDRGQYYRDTFDLEQIEVLMGASSMLFGRGSTGGVINQSTKQASLAKFAEVSGQVTTNGALRSSIDANTPLSDTSAVRLNAFAQNYQTDRDVMKNKDFGFAPNLKFGIGTDTEITLSALLQHNDDMPDYGMPIAFTGTAAQPTYPAPYAPKDAYYGATDDHTTQDINSFGGKIEHKFSPNLVLRSQLQYDHYATDARETAPQAAGTVAPNGAFTQLTAATFAVTPPNQIYVKQQAHDRNINDSSLFNQTDLTVKFGTGDLRHTLLGGFELGHETYSNQAIAVAGSSCNGGVTLGAGFIACTPLVAPAYAPRPNNITSANGNLVMASADTVAGYLNDTVEIGKYFKVVAGLREDNYSAKLQNTVTSATTLPYYSQTVNFTSVRGGVIYQPADWQSYYVSYGTSFDPSLETLTVTNGQQNTPPEKNRTTEIGTKLDLLNGGLSLTGALFEIKKTNARNQIDTGVYELAGVTQVRGLRLGATGHVSDNLQIYAGYLRMNSEVVSGPPTLAGGVITAASTTGNELGNTPRDTFTLWTSYDISHDWVAGAGAVSMSQRWATNTMVATVPGFTRYDAMLGYHQKTWDVTANLLNLTDKFYYEQVAGSDGGRAVPGIGRTVMLTGRYRFQ